MEWSDNIDIANQPPADYWHQQLASKQLRDDRLTQQMWLHGLPDNWTELDYETFLEKRRHLIAAITREGFRKLSDPNFQPVPSPSHRAAEPARPTFEALVHQGMVPAGSHLTPTSGETNSVAEVTDDATILLADIEYRSPDLAANADGAHDVDGWEYWSVDTAEAPTLEELRELAAGIKNT